MTGLKEPLMKEPLINYYQTPLVGNQRQRGHPGIDPSLSNHQDPVVDAGP